MTPKIESPYLHGWDDEKVYFYDENGIEHCVSDEPDLMAKLIAICQDFFKSYHRPKTEMKQKAVIGEALKSIFSGISELRNAFPDKVFTVDGRLVGDIGEVIAASEYDVRLYPVQQADHDGETPEGRKVQVKATFKDSLTFKAVPDYYLGFKLYQDGNYEEIFNGPGGIIFERFKHRKGIGETLLSFPLNELIRLSDTVPKSEKIKRREG